MKQAVALAFALLACGALAQKPVYKCMVNGKTEYSHAPCVGAVEIDATPTRGADQWTGKTRKSQELRHLEFQEGMAKALKPLTGMETDEYLKAIHRQRLAPKDRAVCARLDQLMPGQAEAAERATGKEKGGAEVRLYQSRKRYNDLNC